MQKALIIEQGGFKGYICRMEMDDDNNLPEQEGDNVEIYSRSAVLWFSVLADPLIGGTLLIINLWVAGYKRAVMLMISILIVYEAGISLAEYYYPKYYSISETKMDNNTLVFELMRKGFQVGGGIILAGYFYTKYFPDNDYYPRNILKPLFVTILIIFIMTYFGVSF